jgi:hypothetical protein
VVQPHAHRAELIALRCSPSPGMGRQLGPLPRFGEQGRSSTSPGKQQFAAVRGGHPGSAARQERSVRTLDCCKTRKAAGRRLRWLDPHKRVLGQRVQRLRHDQARVLEAESRQRYAELLPASPASVGAWRNSS